MEKAKNNLVYNQPCLKSIRKKLRQQDIPAEKVLWNKIRNKQLKYKFRRQYSVGRYVLDFYCPKVKLGIEVDGATHGNKIEIKKDIEKENFINRFGVKIIRFINFDIYHEIDGVLTEINSQCEKRESELKIRPHPNPLLIKERE